jgi:very-short-patch-repair endonuclease
MTVKEKKERKFKFLTTLGKKFSKELTKKATKHELIFYKYLKDLHYKFKFQEPIVTKNNVLYIVDFLLEGNLCIELDGSQHLTKEGRKKDNLRTRRLKKEGFHLIRLMNSQISKYSAQDIDNIIKSKIMLIDLEKSKK